MWQDTCRIVTVRAVFEKSWRILARGSDGIRVLEPPPRPQISVIRCRSAYLIGRAAASRAPANDRADMSLHGFWLCENAHCRLFDTYRANSQWWASQMADEIVHRFSDILTEQAEDLDETAAMKLQWNTLCSCNSGSVALDRCRNPAGADARLPLHIAIHR